jgi:polyhydroxyalkanoate synthesis repressor PhaR
MASEDPSTPKGVRVIKRYSNRKLYDTQDSRYVTLQQIGEMVRRGEDVQIIDNKSKDDITEVTLALIISEDLKNKPRSVPLGTLRTLIQERGERVLSSLREGPFGRLIPGDEEEGVEGVAPSDAPPVSAEVPIEVAAQAATAAAQAEGAKDEGAKDDKPGRVKETLNSWQAAFDERVRAVVPGLGLIRDLQAEVARLTQRVEALEKQLGTTDDADDNA